jgi:putative hydrolase of the HAD superfamily
MQLASSHCATQNYRLESRKVANCAKTTFHRPAQTTGDLKLIKAIFFDAVGTLFYLTKTVGHHYALAGAEIGIHLDAQQLDRAFASAWARMPRRSAIDGPRQNDDRDWWRQVVNLVLDEVAPALGKLDRDNFFQIAYGHFAEPGVWELYPDVPGVLGALQPRFQLAVLSNFDGRLRLILRQLNLSRLFSHIFVSSELGADKPDPEIFRRALRLINLQPQEVLHVGDDPERDWEAARAAGLLAFELQRPRNSLQDLLAWVGWDSNPEPTP